MERNVSVVEDGKMYLYDVMNIKKKRVPISSHKRPYSVKNSFLLEPIIWDSVGIVKKKIR